MTKPTVCCVFRNTEPLGLTEDLLLRALQEYMDKHVGPAHGVGCTLKAGHEAAPGEVPLFFLDNADQAGALGYHAADGWPAGYVFVATAKREGSTPPEVAGHELGEMACDLWCDRVVVSPRARLVGFEIADPTEGKTFDVQGVPMPNFALPAWFGRGNPDGADGFDHLGVCSQAWEVQPDGYVPVWDGTGWSAIFGSTVARERYERSDRRLRRTHRRRRACRLPGNESRPSRLVLA